VLASLRRPIDWFRDAFKAGQLSTRAFFGRNWSLQQANDLLYCLGGALASLAE
jgi:hypothetical protein